MTTSTRDRLIDEAMRLFGEQGYRATSVAQIEAAAGLAPGSGGLYHHFRSKEMLLEAGIDRQLDRMNALHDIRQIFEGLTDLRSELTVLGRYTLGVIDEETQLLRIISSELRDRPRKLADTFAALINGSYAGMADWVMRHATGVTREEAEAIAAVALNALYAHRTMPQFLGVEPLVADDERFISEWVVMVAGRVETEPGSV
ncbi:regulatory protein TetR [Gordonia bronchialis DSM 43247]|uniref:Regulatory protein TetR n=1 Tax=Gordonia bronchialis (strain ATCC 25592 / DSM 43247 / BCRC 13721 / JCM 3198 / KCTC 3076 / NBRC 16047 / NCTC 10667) TaxID=526226 RepID=D0L3S1_GORB4|nr:TetR/AcrR family transcriptional regulator [Gordonia bronchialis]ACY23074.1 regulatory protein TetR [Gordonia bronchialis DSM 43247]MCC3325855.1 TetR/AcrR family transcriptional regulator [Gordonia bronchialis]QGS23508.1 TetR family transcriptional regulator [Gordonia bronchialis]UAK40297.1 TetR/AcrR family transcriptional regulator [Gordonia bronchialis]STQ66030.1 HTH-type transcriptional repressor KstR2 [Gordonia bronchialis]